MVLALLLTLLLGIQGFFRSDVRWRQLRASAMQLESIIWKHRTRVEVFKGRTSNTGLSTTPEKLLCAVCTELSF